MSPRPISTTWAASPSTKTCWTRFETYIIKGERGSGCICLNGAAARKVQPDDIVIIMSYALMDFEEAKTFKPTVIFPDPATNKLV